MEETESVYFLEIVASIVAGILIGISSNIWIGILSCGIVLFGLIICNVVIFFGKDLSRTFVFVFGFVSWATISLGSFITLGIVYTIIFMMLVLFVICIIIIYVKK